MAVIRDLDLFHRVDSLLYAQRAFNEIKNLESLEKLHARDMYECILVRVFYVYQDIRMFVE